MGHYWVSCFSLICASAVSRKKNSESAQVWAGCLFITACIFTFFSVYLAGIATFKIHSYCLMCSVLYGVSFILLCTSWLIWKRAGEGTVTDRLKRGLFFLREKRRWILFAGAGFLVVSGALVLFYPKYWQSPELFV
ncbi:hypothetical protein LJC41_09350, partial [Desulfosarcina sp. OttesenSCG-928-G17]|nr:hypothetical protein [Desulfosarcina sp. OttesenSCG-928-G17]